MFICVVRNQICNAILSELIIHGAVLLAMELDYYCNGIKCFQLRVDKQRWQLLSIIYEQVDWSPRHVIQCQSSSYRDDSLVITYEELVNDLSSNAPVVEWRNYPWPVCVFFCSERLWIRLLDTRAAPKMAPLRPTILNWVATVDQSIQLILGSNDCLQYPPFALPTLKMGTISNEWLEAAISSLKHFPPDLCKSMQIFRGLIAAVFRLRLFVWVNVNSMLISSENIINRWSPQSYLPPAKLQSNSIQLINNSDSAYRNSIIFSFD